VPVNGLLFSEGMQIARLALAARLPTVAADRKYVEAGLLASYGIDQRESYRHAASYVDRILKGAKPGDLPIEFPTRIELTINLKTAKALGLDLPPSTEDRTPDTVERCVRHCGGSRPPRGSRPDSERFRSSPRNCRPFCGRLSVR